MQIYFYVQMCEHTITVKFFAVYINLVHACMHIICIVIECCSSTEQWTLLSWPSSQCL